MDHESFRGLIADFQSQTTKYPKLEKVLQGMKAPVAVSAAPIGNGPTPKPNGVVAAPLGKKRRRKRKAVVAAPLEPKSEPKENVSYLPQHCHWAATGPDSVSKVTGTPVLVSS